MTTRRASKSVKAKKARRQQRIEGERRKIKRSLQLETLEPRQLLAVGPQLAGIQPNVGDLLEEGRVLQSAPRELIFRVASDVDLDANTLSGIKITRTGADDSFERASVISDFGTHAFQEADLSDRSRLTAVLQFDARDPGPGGDFINMVIAKRNLGLTGPAISVDGKTITVVMNTAAGRETTAGGLIAAVNSHPVANTLVTASLRSGNTAADLTRPVTDFSPLQLDGTNRARAISDLNKAGTTTLEMLFTAVQPGLDSNNLTIVVQRRNNFGAIPRVQVNTTSDGDSTITVQVRDRSGISAQTLANAINSHAQARTLVNVTIPVGNPLTDVSIGSDATIVLGGANDIEVVPGFIGLADNQRDVIVRFAETLPDDLYRIDILGDGPRAVRDVDGVPFGDTDDDEFLIGHDFRMEFEINPAPQVLAVVPQPVSRTAVGDLQQAENQIVVYFNDDDLFVENVVGRVDANGNPIPTERSAEFPGFYQLIQTERTVTNVDDMIFLPERVEYNPESDMAVLTFAQNLDDLAGAGTYRLRIGTAEQQLTPPRTLLPDSSAISSFDLSQATGVFTANNVFNRLNRTAHGLIDNDLVLLSSTSSLPGGLMASHPYYVVNPSPDSFQVAETPGGLPIDFVTEGAGTHSFTKTPAALRFEAVEDFASAIQLHVSAADLGRDSTDTALPATITVSNRRIQVTLNNDAANAGQQATTVDQLAQLLNNDAAISTFLIATAVGDGSATLGTATLATATTSDFDPLTVSGLGSTMSTASSLGVLNSVQSSLVVTAAIEPQHFGMQLPGASDAPGHRNLRPEIQQHLNQAADAVNGITTLEYNFKDVIGTDPRGNVLRNVITETQMERAREIFEIFGEEMGLDFVETPDRGISVATGDMRAADPTIPTGPNDGILYAIDPDTDLVVMDLQEFSGSDDQFGEAWFVTALGAFLEVLGLGETDELPPPTFSNDEPALNFNNNPAPTIEPVFPGDHDIVHGQHLYRPDSIDVDLYRFEVTTPGVVSFETFAERLQDSSLLDTYLQVFMPVFGAANQPVDFELLAQNDNYFSNDSFVELTLEPGVYFVGVSASGNDDYHPLVEDSGFGGTSEGRYELRADFKPLGAQQGITDDPNHLVVIENGTKFVDGQIMSIRDSRGLVQRFEFDSNGTASEFGTRLVAFNASDTPREIASKIVDQVNRAGLFINASFRGGRIRLDGAAAVNPVTLSPGFVGIDASPEAQALDGDADGNPGGVFNFWFNVTEPRTLLVNGTGSSFQTGDFFTLVALDEPTGERVAITFEFVMTGNQRLIPNSTPISLTGAETQAEVVAAITTAINDATFVDITGRTSAIMVDATPVGNRIFLSGELSVITDPNSPVTREIQTLFVDKSNAFPLSSEPIGTRTNPFNEIDRALAAAAPGQIVRVVGNGGADGDIATLADNLAYEIGFNGLAEPLADGTTLEVPSEVTLMIDAGAILKLRRARIGVGSSAPGENPVFGLPVDRSNAALQVLGTPRLVDQQGNVRVDEKGRTMTHSVYFTSILDDEIGVKTTSDIQGATPGDWGGISFRRDVDRSEGRPDAESAGLFVDYIAGADIQYGGGTVMVDGVPRAVAPIYMADARPTVISSKISVSADSAMSANPDSFLETRFSEPVFQAGAPFTSDYTRIGPHIRGNTIVENSLNGLFIRTQTPSGGTLEELTVAGRWDDADITHIVGEDLLIRGTPGGPIRDTETPPPGLVQLFRRDGQGLLPAGTYNYRISFVDRNGNEGLPSEATGQQTALVDNSAIQLTNLPGATSTSDFQARRIYRSQPNGEGPYVLAAQINVSDPTWLDDGSQSGPALPPIPAAALNVTLEGAGNLRAGTYNYKIAYVHPNGTVGLPSDSSLNRSVSDGSSVRVANIPAAPADATSVLIYRSEPGGRGPYSLAGEIAPGTAFFIDDGPPVDGTTEALLKRDRSRLDGRLAIDPGVVVKLEGTRIDTTFGGQLIAEGRVGQEIVFTSLQDDTYGVGGSLKTRNVAGTINDPAAGQWGGLFVGHMSEASIDHALISYGGGVSRLEGGFAGFNALEIHQAEARIANSVLSNNDDGTANQPQNSRLGKGFNSAASIFVRGSQPVIVNNIIDNNVGAAVSVDVNSLNHEYVVDKGRTAFRSDVSSQDLNPTNRSGESLDNQGPLLRNNRLDRNGLNGMEVRGGTLTTEGVWDDTDIVHVLQDSVDVTDFHTFGGLRLESQPAESLVVKSFNLDGASGDANAPDIAGITSSGRPLDISDRIGGMLHVVGQPGAPVILTSLADDSIGAGFKPNGEPQTDTGNDGDGSTTSGGGGLPTGPEVNNGTLIDNDVAPGIPGQFAFDVSNGGDSGFGGGGISALGRSGTVFSNIDVLFAFTNFVDVGSDGQAVSLGATQITMPAALIADDLVASEGNLTGPNGQIDWRAETRMDDGQGIVFNTITFSSAAAFGNVQFINYLDEDVQGISDDVLYQVGTPGQPDFRAFTLDGPERIGFSQGGVYTPTPGELENATYDGWAADEFSDLVNAITGAGTTYTVAGNIDVQSLPPFNDPDLGTLNGPADITSAFAWTLDPASNTATITTFLELIASDPITVTPGGGASGDWQGIRLDEYTHDRNVGLVLEREASNQRDPDSALSTFGNNNAPGNAEFLGALAPIAQAGDDVQRLGFEVHGFLNRPNDNDVYSFDAEAGTQVWFDIDRTRHALDTVVELIDASGNVLARSDNSAAEFVDPSLLFSAAGVRANPMPDSPDTELDRYSTNARDAGMRVVLPGSTGTTGTYYVRVRSNGVTSGAYQMQVRLQARDEFPGAMVQHADIRFAANGIDVLGLPLHSPLLGDAAETEDAQNRNDSAVNAEFLGNILASDHASISVAGTIDSDTDVDWYQFDLDYLSVSDDESFKHAALTFDIDYADGLGRANTNLYVYRETGQGTLELVFAGTDSNIVDDRQSATGDRVDNLSRGSVGALDPFIGPVELPTRNQVTVPGLSESGRYFVAVTSNAVIPEELDQLQAAVPFNTLVRTEPVNSVLRVGEHHVSPPLGADFVADPATNRFTSIAHGLQDGDLVWVSSTGTLPTPLTAEAPSLLPPFDLVRTVYVVRDAEDDTFRLTTEDGEPPIDVTTAGLGTHRFERAVGQSNIPGSPTIDIQFDVSAVPFFLGDVTLFVSQDSTLDDNSLLRTINPFTGDLVSTVGQFAFSTEDIVFDPDGSQLYAYTNPNGPVAVNDANSGNYFTIDPSSINTTDISTQVTVAVQGGGGGGGGGGGPQTMPADDGILTYIEDVNMPGTEVRAGNTATGVGIAFNAMEIGLINGANEGLVVGTRNDAGFAPGVIDDTNILYHFNVATGEAITDLPDMDRMGPALLGNTGTDVIERGVLRTGFDPITTSGGDVSAQTPDATNYDATNGITLAQMIDGLTATILDADGNQLEFEFNTGPEVTVAHGPADNRHVLDGQTFSLDGTTYEFNTGSVLDVVALTGAQIFDGDTITITDNAPINPQVRTFEFDNNTGPPIVAGNIPITFTNQISQQVLVQRIMAAINNNGNFAVTAEQFGATSRITLRNENDTPGAVSSQSSGVSVFRAPDSGRPDLIDVEETDDAVTLAAAIADQIVGSPSMGEVNASAAGTRLNFAGALSGVFTNVTTGVFTSTGADGLISGDFPVDFGAGDSGSQVADAFLTSLLNNGIQASRNGDVVTLEGGARYVAVDTPMIIGGDAPGGEIHGLAMRNDRLFAVSDRGGLFEVVADTGAAFDLIATTNIADYVETAIDLQRGEVDARGLPTGQPIQFTALAFGPENAEGGRFADMLFGMDVNGRLYAFDTAGVLQPVFLDGQTSIQTGIVGGQIQGMQFAKLDTNLWHETDPVIDDVLRTNRPANGLTAASVGHGVTEPFDGSRNAEAQDDIRSFYFGYEGETIQPELGTATDLDLPPATALNTYDFQGGAHGSMITRPFSLRGVSPADLPTLYFNYFLETENDSVLLSDDGFMTDSFRVYGAGSDGQWKLLTTNNNARGGGEEDDEYDAFDNRNEPTPVRELFDVDASLVAANTQGPEWRQARVWLGEFAGDDRVRLRFDFSTSGSMNLGGVGLTASNGQELHVLPASDLRDGDTFTVRTERINPITGVLTQQSDTFEFDFGYSFHVPSGDSLASGSTLFVNGVRFEFNSNGDGVGNVVPFAADSSANEIATAFHAQLVNALPGIQVVREGARIGVSGVDAVLATGLPATFVASRPGVGATNFPVPVNIGMDPLQVTERVAQALADRFAFVRGGGSLTTGTQIVAANSGGLVQPQGIALGPDGNLYVASAGNNQILKYDGQTGAFLDIFVASGAGGLSGPHSIRFGPDDNLYVTSTQGANAVIRYQGPLAAATDPAPGTPIGTVGANALSLPRALAFDGNGILYVSSVTPGTTSSEIRAFNSATGTLIGNGSFVASGAGGLSEPQSMVFGPDDHLYVADAATNTIQRYDGQTGTHIDQFVDVGDGGIDDPRDIAFGRDGSLFVSEVTNNSVLRFDGRSGLFVDQFAISGAGGLNGPFGIAFEGGPNGNLLVASRESNEIFRFDGFVGTGQRSSIKTFDNIIKMIGHDVVDPGVNNAIKPLGLSTALSGDQFGAFTAGTDEFGVAPAGTTGAEQYQNNNFAGVYVDDIVIGFAERGELVTGATQTETDPQFVANLLQDGNEINVGPYQLEIRRATAFGETSATPDTDLPITLVNSFDTNTRQSNKTTLVAPAGADIRPNQQFTLSDGLNDITFVFVDVSNGAVDNRGDGRIPFTPVDDSSTIARRIRDEINSPEVQALLKVSAGLEDGTSAPNDPFASSSDRVALSSNAFITGDNLPDGFVLAPELTGDDNTVRDQGQIVLDSNIIRASAGFGIRAGACDSFETLCLQGGLPPINLPQLNTERLAPGVTITNTLFEHNQTGGIHLAGSADPSASVPFGRVLNNTIVGDGVGTGILVENNASPTLLNNIVTDSANGIDVDATSATTVIGGTVFKGNTNNTTASTPAGTFAIALLDTDPLFVDSDSGNYYLAPGSKAIDSSINSLVDRPALTTVRSPLGLPESPINSPDRDNVGQLRVDDPTVEPPFGFGANVFKDRGAIDRVDFTGPTAVMLEPRDNDANGEDVDRRVTFTEVDGIFDHFAIQLIDGVLPADPVGGIGADDASVIGDAITVHQGARRLEQGIDYDFRYDRTNNVIRLQPTSGIWPPNEQYTVTLANKNGFAVTLAETIADGDSFDVVETNGNVVNFEFDSGFELAVPQSFTLLIPRESKSVADGQTFVVGQGGNNVTFEFDNNTVVGGGNVAIKITDNDTVDDIALAIVRALDGANLGLDPKVLAGGKVHLGSDSSHTLNVGGSSLIAVGQAGSVQDGEQFFFDDGRTGRLLFEFDFGNGTQSGARAIRVSQRDTHADIAGKIVNAINGANLGASASQDMDEDAFGDMVLNGVVIVQGERHHQMDAANAASLTLTGQPGVRPEYTLRIPTIAGRPTGITDGDTFSIDDGLGFTATFELESDGIATPGNLIIPFEADVNGVVTTTLTTLSNRMVNVLRSARLGLNPINTGDGFISLGATANHVVNLGNSAFTTLGTPGVPAAEAIESPFTLNSIFDAVNGAIQAGLFTSNNNSIAGDDISAELDVAGDRVLIFGAASVTGLDSIIRTGIRDLANNALKANRTSNVTQFTITLGGTIGTGPTTFDFGDAPASYGTLFDNDGARHQIVPGFTLGANVDSDFNGQPSQNADADDLDGPNPSSDDDEDGVFFDGSRPLIPNQMTEVIVTANGITPGQPGRLDFFIDFNHDGDFTDANERIFDSQLMPNGMPLNNGENLVRFRVPGPASEIQRLTGAVGNTGTFLAIIGNEVQALSGGSSAAAVRSAFERFSFINPGDIAVTGGPLNSANPVTITYVGNLQTTDIPDLTVDLNLLNGTVVADNFADGTPGAATGITYARFRYSSAGGLSPTGSAVDGEVEDYQITTVNNPWHNAVRPVDVNDDGHLSPIDALQVIRHINFHGVSALPLTPPLISPSGTPIFPPPYIDVTGDLQITARDALEVIAALRSANVLAVQAGEAEPPAAMSAGTATATSMETVTAAAIGVISPDAGVKLTSQVVASIPQMTRPVAPAPTVNAAAPTVANDDGDEQVHGEPVQRPERIEVEVRLPAAPGMIDLEDVLDDLVSDSALEPERDAHDELFARF